MTDIASIITALGGALVPVGGGIGFLWRHIDRKFSAVEAKLTECQRRDEANRQGLHVISLSCVLLIEEVKGASPQNPAIRKVTSMLKTAFPADSETPPTWAGLLEALQAAAGEK